MFLSTLIRFVAIVIGLLTLLTIQSTAQQVGESSAGTQSDALPPEMRYYMLFTRWLSKPSPNLPSSMYNGPNGTAVPRTTARAIIQRDAQLTDYEARILDQITEDCRLKVRPLEQRRTQLIGQLRVKYPSRDVTPPENGPERKELSELKRQQDSLVLKSVAQLRAQLGEAEFQRLDAYVLNHGDGRRMPAPPPNKKPLPVQVNLTLFDRQGETARRQFAANERFSLQITMLNNSSQMISVKPSEVFAWLMLLPTEDPLEINLLFKLRGDHVSAYEPVALPPNQATLVTQIILGMGDIVLKPGPYEFTIHDKVALIRPATDGEWLALSLMHPLPFRIANK